MRLRTYLKERKLSITKLSRLSGCSYQTVSKLVGGKGNPISISMLNKIANGLGVQMLELTRMTTNLNCIALDLLEVDYRGNNEAEPVEVAESHEDAPEEHESTEEREYSMEEIRSRMAEIGGREDV